MKKITLHFASQVSKYTVLGMVIVVAVGCGKQKDKKEESSGRAAVAPVPAPAPEKAADASSPSTPPAPKPDGSGHVVMVVDGGFDANHEAFKNKVAGTYSLVCDEASRPAEPKPEDAANFESLKAFTLNSKIWEHEKCDIKEVQGYPLAKVWEEARPHREEWVNTLKAKKEPSEQLIQKAIMKVWDEMTHGTSVAGLVAYHNPNVKVVFVEIKDEQFYPGLRKYNLKSKRTKREDESFGPPEPMPPEKCDPEFDNMKKHFETLLKVYEDPDFKAKYVSMPYSKYEKQREELYEKHKVTLVNMSYGIDDPASNFSNLMGGFAEMCPNVNDYSYKKISEFREIFTKGETARNELLKAQNDARLASGEKPKVTPLILQSAANSGAVIDTFEQSPDCVKDSSNVISIGSYNWNHKRSDFSALGECVDFYALGERVLSSLPDNWLDVVDGTSFASPLAARYITQNFLSTATPQEIIEGLKKLVDHRGFLPKDSFPKELAWEDEKSTVESFSLYSYVSRYFRRP